MNPQIWGFNNLKGDFMNKCECPICHKQLGSLNMHVVYSHGMKISEFREKYPDIRMQIPNKKTNMKSICPYCGKEYSSKNGLGTHIAYTHKNLKRGDAKNKNKQRCSEGYICPICSKMVVNIYQHVCLKHEMEWDDFCHNYNWNGMKKYVSENAHMNLSKNKKAFYDSSHGQELKKRQSEKMRGEKNIVYFTGVRDKLVRKTKSNGVSVDTGYGINIKLKCGIYLRSFNEFVIYSFFKEHNIPFEYEGLEFEYVHKGEKHIYFPDFIVGKDVYELKPYSMMKINSNSFRYSDRYMVIRKYVQQKGFNFELLNPTMLLLKYGITYSGGKSSLKERRNKLFEYMSNGLVDYILINKGKSEVKTFIEKESRWSSFDNIKITYKKETQSRMREETLGLVNR